MAIRFGSKAHRDFISDHKRQQKIDKVALFNTDKCLEAISEFIKKVGTMEPVAEKIVLEAIRNCESKEGMTSNARIFRDYLTDWLPDSQMPHIEVGKTHARALMEG